MSVDANGSERVFDPAGWRDELVSFARRMGAAGDAEDIVQEAFVRAIARPPERSPRAYLYRTVLHLLMDRGRATARWATARSGAVERRRAEVRETTADPAAAAERSETIAAAWRAARELPAKQRAALLLRVRDDMSYEELAEALETTAATARQYVYLAARTVRRALATPADEDGAEQDGRP